MDEKVINELVAEERRAYQKEWREKNKDKVQQYNKKFFLKRAAARLAASKQSGEDNGDRKD